VKANASFEQVIACYNLRLLGSGSQRTLLCPFHRERKPSCKINLEKRVFHCFGCGTKGNVLEFVARLEGDAGDLRAATMKIADICGIATAAPREPTGQRSAGEHRRKEAKPQKITLKTGPAETAPAAESDEPINSPLTFALKLEPEHPYLEKRGLSPEVVAEFGLGYCGRGTMAGRICIPIHNETGELVAYAGRWPEDDPPDDIERYKLPTKFQKSRVLFNLHRVEGEHVVLVEGYWSAIRLHTLGVAVAALMGCSVSAEQIALLRERGIRFMTLLLDGDEAGSAARERVLPALTSALFVRAPLLPDGQKPDTIPERALRELVEFGKK
jgi:DNA primase